MSLTAYQTGSTTERIVAASITGNLGDYGVQLFPDAFGGVGNPLADVRALANISFCDEGR